MTSERPWWIPAVDMRAIVVLLVFSYFGYAYLHDPSDETLKGALIAAFSGAWGFYLGSSKSAGEVRDQLDTATKTARDAVSFAREVATDPAAEEEPVPVKVVQPKDEPVPTVVSKPVVETMSDADLQAELAALDESGGDPARADAIRAELQRRQTVSEVSAGVAPAPPAGATPVMED